MKKKVPPCALSDSDIDLLLKLHGQTDDLRKRVSELIRFIKNLENSYPIRSFTIADYLPKDWEGNKKEPNFHNPEYFHAAKAYVSSYLLLLTGVTKNDAEKYLGKFFDYCWNEIERIEKETTVDENDFSIRVNIIYYLELIFGVAIRFQDVTIFLKSFTKLVDYIDFIGKLDSWAKLTNSKFYDLAHQPFESFINNTLDLLNYSEDVFVNHPKLIQCYMQAISYALDDEPCLILGETGTGKELIARVIHTFSRRRENNFVAVNCGGFTDSLFNSEIQGIIKGGATGVSTRLGIFLKATGKNIGLTEYGYIIDKELIKFRSLSGKLINRGTDVTRERAKRLGGTAFLDEINSLDIDHQAALLRIIQEREVNVIGEDFSRKFSAKVICASNSNLQELIPNGRFRPDLYYRIAKGIVEVPPLRDLKESFDKIIPNRVDNICKRIGIKKRVNVPVSSLRKLKKHQWPGNFRELDGTLYRALKKIDLDNSASLKPSYIEYESVPTKADNIQDYRGIKFDSLISDYMQYLYRITGGHQTKSAELAGMKRNRLRDHWIRYGIIEGKPKKDKGPNQ